MKRILFVLANTALTGRNKVLFEIMNRLVEGGDQVEVVFYYTPGETPGWFPLKATVLPTNQFEAVPLDSYDVALVTQMFLVPLVAPCLTQTPLLYLSQTYESHGFGRDGHAPLIESFTMLDILKHPLPIVATSRNLQACYREKVGRSVYHLPVGLDKALFYPRPPVMPDHPKRVLMVGNYLSPQKAMSVGFAALEAVSREMPVQLVLLTPETRHRAVLDELPFPVEVHTALPLEQVPDLYASCHAYLCASQYETMPLAPLEAMAMGVPVVSTANPGITNYGIDCYNMALARINDPADLARQLLRVLSDSPWVDRLRQNALAEINSRYHWDETMQILHAIMEQESAYGLHPQLRLRPDQARSFLVALEREGYFTPYPVWQTYQTLVQELHRWSQSQLETERHAPSDCDTLRDIAQGFQACLGVETSPHYAEAKGYRDLCHLLLSQWEEPAFCAHLRQVMAAYDIPEPVHC